MKCITCGEPAKLESMSFHPDCPDCQGHGGGWRSQCGHGFLVAEDMSELIVPVLPLESPVTRIVRELREDREAE